MGNQKNLWRNNPLNAFMKIEEKVNQYIKQFKNATEHLDPADGRLKKLDIDFVRKLSRIIETHPRIKTDSRSVSRNRP